MNNLSEQVREIIQKELSNTEEKIWSRLEQLLKNNFDIESNTESIIEEELKPLPQNSNYSRVLEMYQKGESHSAIARDLGVTLMSEKRYYNWLANNGYINAPEATLSEKELEVTTLLYDEGMSLNEAATKLLCSVGNVTYMRNSALRKQYLSKYIIKIVYPGFYKYIDKPTLGFPKNRESIARKIEIGQKCFVYVTSPVQKIITLVEIVSDMRITQSPRWPFDFDVKFIIPPKQGVALKDVGIEQRLRQGDTLIHISNQKALEIIDKLNSQLDLTSEQLDKLAFEFKNF